MTTFALLSEYHLLTPAQKSQVDHIVCDDGEWTQEMITLAIQFPLEDPNHEDRWDKP